MKSHVIQPFSGDVLTGKGQTLKYIEDPEQVRQTEALCDTLYQRCSELMSKPSTGPNLMVLLEFVQTALQDMKDGKDYIQETNDDPIYFFTTSPMNDLKAPIAGSETARDDGELLEYTSRQLPVYLMVQHGLDVHRKIRDFRERIDPTDTEAFDTAKESLKRTLDEYEKTALRLLHDVESPSHAKVRDRILQKDSWNVDILGVRGYNGSILPLIRDYKEGLSLGIDPALLPQYSLMKRAYGQLDEAVAALRGKNEDGRYNEMLESADNFKTAFQSLMANEDPSKSEELMEGVCRAMNELFDNAGDTFKAHKNNLTLEEMNAITLLRSTDQKYLESKSSFNTFRHITETVEKHYEKRRQLKEAAPGSLLRERQKALSGQAFQDDRWITSTRQKQNVANLHYLEMNWFYFRKHKNSIEANTYDNAFQDKHLFTEKFGAFYPRLVLRFPDLANPDVKDKVSVLSSAAGHYIDTLEEIVRKASENLIETRHFVKNGKLLTDRKAIGELMDPDNSKNPLYAYWQYIKDAREDLKKAASVEEVQETTRHLTESFQKAQEHHRTYGDPDAAAAIKVQMDDALGELKLFAGPSDYGKYFTRRVEALGTNCREEQEAIKACERLFYYCQHLHDPRNRKHMPIEDDDVPKLQKMADIALDLSRTVNALQEHKVKNGRQYYLPTAIDPNGEKINSFLETYNSLSPVARDYLGNFMRERDAAASTALDDIEDPFKNNYIGEDDLRLVSEENIDRFRKLALEAADAKSRFFDHQEFLDYRAALQAVSDYAETVKNNPGSTEVNLHMAELMRNAGQAAQTYLSEKGEGKRSSEVGNIRYNNAYAAFYLTSPKEATQMAQEAKNLHVSAERAKGRQAREHLSLEALMKEEFGNLDRTYKKSAHGQGYEKVAPAPEKKGKKK